MPARSRQQLLGCLADEGALASMQEIQTVVSDGTSVATTANISILARMLDMRENRRRVRALLRRGPPDSCAIRYRNWVVATVPGIT
jgi:hypothetical protein